MAPVTPAFDLRFAAGWFRLIALAEAVSWVGLLIGMYFKYLGTPRTETGVKVFGMAHGLVFIAFVVAGLLVGIALNENLIEDVDAPLAELLPSNTAKTAPTQRDRHLQMIQARGRLGWQKAVNYGRRSLGEVAMMRYKTLIGRRLHARTLSTQKTEAAAGCKVINIMTQLGMPMSQRIT